MVVRVWRGKTRSSDADAYQEYLSTYDGYRNTPGYLASLLLRRPELEETEFVLISVWASKDAIARYAGADTEAANLRERDRTLLTTADLRAVHYTLAFSDVRSTHNMPPLWASSAAPTPFRQPGVPRGSEAAPIGDR